MNGFRLVPPVSERDHLTGPMDARVTLVEYGDFQCVYCRIAHPVVRAARRVLGNDLRFAFRHFPLSEIHPHARLAAQAAEAAAAQGRFWEMHDMLLVYQNALEHDDLVKYARALGLDVPRVIRELRDGTHSFRVRRNLQGGVRSGVIATPTFFVNGERYDGAWIDVPSFIRALQEAAEHAPDTDPARESVAR